MPDLTADEVRAALPCCKDPAAPVLTIVPCGGCYPCRIRDSWLALHAALAAKDAENERLRGALEQIAFPPLRVTGFGDIETVDEYDPAGVAVAALDARAALADGEATG